MKVSSELIEFLNLSPLDQVRYSLHCLNAWTSAPRNYVVIKLVRILSFLKLEKASFYVLLYSGLLKRIMDKNMLAINDIDNYLIDYGFPTEWLGYGDRLRYPWRHTFTRIAMFFRVK